MKKFYLIVAGLCLALALLIGGSILIDKKLEKDSSFITDNIDMEKYASTSDSLKKKNSKNNGSFSEMEITGKEVKADNISKITDEHELILTDIGEIKVDAGLSEEEWQSRIDLGIDSVAINRANKDCSKLFYYSNTPDDLKQLYLEIYIALSNYTESFYICSINPDDIDYSFNCVMGDHPEIFYSNGYMYTKYTVEDAIIKIEFTPAYTMSKADAEEAMKHVKEYRDDFMKGISKTASDYEKIKYTYEFIIINTEYDINSVENQNILSVFLYGKSVCQGYSKAFQYLVNDLGVQCALVVGYVQDNEGHAWNIVKCNSQYYYIDCTWGDSSYLVNTTSVSTDGINFDYLNITTAELEMTHNIDNFADVPMCISTRDNYYVKEGLYFTDINETQISEAFKNANALGRDTVELKCSSSSVFDRMGKFLLDENHVFDYMSSDKDTLTYKVNQELYIYSFPLR